MTKIVLFQVVEVVGGIKVCVCFNSHREMANFTKWREKKGFEEVPRNGCLL